MSSEKYKIDEVYAAQLKEKVEGLRGGITEKAHHLVYVVMPQRVLALTELFAVCILFCFVFDMNVYSVYGNTNHSIAQFKSI